MAPKPKGNAKDTKSNPLLSLSGSGLGGFIKMLILFVPVLAVAFATIIFVLNRQAGRDRRPFLFSPHNLLAPADTYHV